MKRNLNFSTIIRAAGFAKYLPLIIFQIKNWPEFMLHYAGVKNGGEEYVFRNGIRIKTNDAVSAATIAVIFIKKDYGDIPVNSGVSSKKETRKLYLGDSPFHSFLPAKESPFNVLYGATKSPAQAFSQINCLSLKDIFDANSISVCHLLKMDCEGAEYEILYNAPDECFKKIKEIRLEYHNHESSQNNNGECLKNFLEKKGFTVKKFKKGS